MQQRTTICRQKLARLATLPLCLLLSLPALAQQKSADPDTSRRAPVAQPRKPDSAAPVRPPDANAPVKPPAEAPRKPPAEPPARDPGDTPRRPPAADAPRRPPPTPDKPPRAPDADAPRTGSVAEEVRRPPTAEEPRRPADSAEIKILVILATNQNDRVDPALRGLAEQFRPTFKFSGYQLLRTDSRRVELGISTTFPLAGTYALQITPTAIESGRVVMNVLTLRGVGQSRGIGLQMRASPGKYQLLGGWPVANGTLLAAVTARPAS